jgi:hypothetical protein
MEGLSGIVADWLRFRQRAVKLEQKFWANDRIMKDVKESFPINLSAGDSGTKIMVITVFQNAILHLDSPRMKD